MGMIDPRIPLTEVTEPQYAVLTQKEPGMLYAVPYGGIAVYASGGDGTLTPELTIRYFLDTLPFYENTLYCVAQLEPVQILGLDLLTTDAGDLLCVRSDAGELYSLQATGIRKMTRQEYDDLAFRYALTKYIVTDGDEVHEYLGTVLIK